MAIEGREVPIYGDGSQKRDFSYVDDVVDALLVAAAADETNGEVYNIGSGVPISVLDTLRTIIKIAGRGSFRLVDFPEDKKRIEVGDYYADFSKFSKATGWKPRTGFEEGLRKTVEYYEKYREHYW
jgi:UDP-glucose 4-epimerase